MANQTTTTHISKPRERLLETAAGLFYGSGIHSVGVDRILAEANVTRATMYRHFAGKEGLVGAYLALEDERTRARFATLPMGEVEAGELIDLLIEHVAVDVEHHHTRGCPFINAAAEYPDPDSDVRVLVQRHRSWLRGILEESLASAGVDDPAAAAASLVLLRDAALVGGYLDGVEPAAAAFRSTARGALGVAVA
ncbi:MAG: TetR/AcrR family transcriptional regulator [Thermoleophilia bacterium]|jgi:AcrR family transcriptional regulator|nr:TetR/AcrR family transcriptional regulator [Thermoleophilia bacterium]